MQLSYRSVLTTELIDFNVKFIGEVVGGEMYQSDCGKIFEVNDHSQVYLIGSNQQFTNRKWISSDNRLFDKTYYLGLMQGSHEKDHSPAQRTRRLVH